MMDQPIIENEEIIIKLVCRHRYHSECLNDYVLTYQDPTCCACLGPCRISDRYRFNGVVADGAEMHTRQESFHSTYPWYPAPDTQQPAGYFYAKTELASGEPAALIDPGAWTSAGGELNGRKLAIAATKAGFKPTQKKMETPLKIAGVGNGVQQCIWQANIPVAIP